MGWLNGDAERRGYRGMPKWDAEGRRQRGPKLSHPLIYHVFVQHVAYKTNQRDKPKRT